MGTIEEAAQRLQQLRAAGVELSESGASQADGQSISESSLDAGHTPERFVQSMRQGAAAESQSAISTKTSVASATSAGSSRESTQATHRSRMVELDLVALAEAGLVTPEAQRSQIADEFRVVKRPIIRNAKDKSTMVERGNLVMVTSALPGEGKSFTALNLAMSIASEVDSTVLLVDADVANPNLMQLMGLSRNSKGLLDLLTTDSITLPDVLLRTNVEKLSILPAGTAHRRATEMLASQAMVRLVEEMASRYHDRILVFDSPPLLATTEARVLASHMGQIVMVVEADRTTEAMVKQALETIDHCPVVMMVLNKAPRSEVGSYYGYGYGYSGATAAPAASSAP